MKATLDTQNLKIMLAPYEVLQLACAAFRLTVASDGKRISVASDDNIECTPSDLAGLRRWTFSRKSRARRKKP